MIDDSQLVNSLLEEGFLDQATLKESLKTTKQTGRSLYETLISREVMPEATLVNLVSEMLDVPVGEVNPAAIPEDVRSLVPGSMAHRSRVLPLNMHEGKLILGMADPADSLAMDEIATHTGIEISPVLLGPSTISDALAEVYGASGSADLADDLMASFDDFDVQGMMDEVMAGDDWDELFPEPEEEDLSLEDSSVLSMEMRDRPTTDVLAEEDIPDSIEAPADEDEELPEIEIVEELGKPIPRSTPPDPYSSLDGWEVDDAITGNLAPGQAGDSEILSAASAQELFASSPADAVRLEAQESDIDDEEDSEPGDAESSDAEDSDAEDSDPADADDSDDSDSEEVEEVDASKTSVGVGVSELEDLGAAESEVATDTDSLESTGRTALGVGPMLADEIADAPEASSADAKAKPPPTETRDEEEDPENTDYGALGRAILKTKPGSDPSELPKPPKKKPAGSKSAAAAPPKEPTAPETDNEAPTDAKTNVREPNQDRPTDPLVSEKVEPETAAKADTDNAASPPEEPEEPEEPQDLAAPETEARDTADEPVEKGSATEIISPQQDAEDEFESGLAPSTSSAEEAIEPIESEVEVRATTEDALLPEEIKQLEEASAERDREERTSARLPKGVDTEGLALALANLLIAKEILTLEEVFELAKSLSEEPD